MSPLLSPKVKIVDGVDNVTVVNDSDPVNSVDNLS